MPMYTFHLCDAQGMSNAFEAFELANDPLAVAKAATLLDQHASCEHIDVRDADRPVAARHRNPPVIRPVQQPSHAAQPA